MVRKGAVSIFAVLTLSVFAAKAVAQPSNIYQATLGEPNQKTQEISTEYVRTIAANGGVVILDTRSRSEYASGHIPTARVLEGSASAAVAAVERLLGGDKNAAVVLYCNSPYCGQSRRLGKVRRRICEWNSAGCPQCSGGRSG